MNNLMHFGWMTSSGEMHPVKLYDHIDFLKLRYPEFGYEEILRSNEEFIQQQEDLYAEGISEGEHPEWHVIEIWADHQRNEPRQKLYEYAYSQGLMRYGTYQKGSQCFYEFEGDPKFFDDFKPVWEQLNINSSYGICFLSTTKKSFFGRGRLVFEPLG